MVMPCVTDPIALGIRSPPGNLTAFALRSQQAWNNPQYHIHAKTRKIPSTTRKKVFLHEIGNVNANLRPSPVIAITVEVAGHLQ